MKRALIVDDNPQILSLTRRWLVRAGYDVSTSADFHEARLWLQTGQLPEALIVDVRLNGHNGLQLALLAKSVDPHVHIVVISAWSDPVLEREAVRFGATFVSKPFNESQLLSALGDEGSAYVNHAVAG